MSRGLEIASIVPKSRGGAFGGRVGSIPGRPSILQYLFDHGQEVRQRTDGAEWRGTGGPHEAPRRCQHQRISPRRRRRRKLPEFVYAWRSSVYWRTRAVPFEPRWAENRSHARPASACAKALHLASSNPKGRQNAQFYAKSAFPQIPVG